MTEMGSSGPCAQCAYGSRNMPPTNAATNASVTRRTRRNCSSTSDSGFWLPTANLAPAFLRAVRGLVFFRVSIAHPTDVHLIPGLLAPVHDAIGIGIGWILGGVVPRHVEHDAGTG